MSKVKKKEQVQFRYYEIAQGMPCLSLLGPTWERNYGNDVDYLHFHNYLEIGYCYYGAGEVFFEEEHLRYENDTFTILPKNFPHHTQSDFGSICKWEYMYIDVEDFFLKKYPDNPFFVKTLSDRINSRPLLLSRKRQKEMAGLIVRIFDELRDEREFYVETVTALIHALLMCIARHNRVEISAENTKVKDIKNISSALDFLDLNFAEDISVHDLADVCNMSETHFRRTFLRSMNMTPGDYINLVRCQKACDYMRKHSEPMEIVAEKCGFMTVSTFNRNFKKIMDVTPYQWKIHPENYEGKLMNYKISARKGW